MRKKIRPRTSFGPGFFRARPALALLYPAEATSFPNRAAPAAERHSLIERYIYRLIDIPARLFRMKPNLSQAEITYARLGHRLAKIGWISQGYVQDRGPGAGGPCYQWTRKVKAKTVSVALSKQQFLALKQAIANWRQLQETLKHMQVLSRRVIFETLPSPPRRKRLGTKVLGLG
jgi:hypothetical protein